MELSKKVRETIDEMSYDQMKGIWEGDPTGIPILEGESGIYFLEVLERKGKERVEGWAE